MADEFKSLLLEEYKARSDAMAKGEQSGETRVNLFIGLITLVGGGAGALLTKGSSFATLSDERRILIVVALFSLLIVGAITLLRIITRNKHTDLCKRQLDQLRRVYKDQFDTDGTWAHYDLFPRYEKKDEKKEGTGDRLLPREFGGLAYVVAGLNALLLTAAVAALAVPHAENYLALLFIGLAAVLVGVFAVQIKYVQHKENEAREESKKRFPEVNRAGGIVYRLVSIATSETVKEGTAEAVDIAADASAHSTAPGVVKYLLVETKASPKTWVLPKGHIDPGETDMQAAVREVMEEAGVVARPMGVVGWAKFKSGSEAIVAKYYLMEKIGEVPATESRNPRWFTLSEAKDNLKPESAKLLLLAEQHRLALPKAAPLAPPVAGAKT